MLRHFLLPLFALSFPGSPCRAVDYHVATQHPAADDANPGTVEKPFKTLAAGAAKRLKAGDTLFVHAGVYRETLSLTGGTAANGKPGARIRIMACPGESVEIKGSDLVKDWKKFKDAPAGADGIARGAIYVRENWRANSQQVFCDGRPLTQIAGDVGEGYVRESWKGRKGEGLADLEEGSFYCDRSSQRLYLWLPTGDDPAAHEVEAQVRTTGILLRDLNHHDISGFKITHANLNIGGTYGAYNTVDGCEVDYSDFCGISLGGSFNTLINCKSNHNGNTGISTYFRGHRVVNCEVRFNNRRSWSASWHAGGMKNFSSDTVISGCTAEGNLNSPGIWFDGSNAGVTIENNRCFRNAVGIMYEIGERAIVRNNLCYENTGRGIYISNSAECSILFNLCCRNGMSGIAVVGVERPGEADADFDTGFVPARDNVVWGNILMDNCHPSLALKGWAGRPELILPDDRISSNRGNISDYNIYYRSDGRGIPFWWNWGVNLCKDLQEWRDKTGQDRHSLIAEPLFMNAAAYDFRPAEKSPAILFAKSRMGLLCDADGRHRIRGKLTTAGPFEADKKFLPATKPPVPAQSEVLALDHTTPLPAVLAALTAALSSELTASKLPDGKTGLTLKGIPFQYSTPPAAALLSGNAKSYKLDIGRGIKSLHVLFGIIDPGPGRPLRCQITRQDGQVVNLQWETGKNIGPSLGTWDASGHTPGAKDFRTEVVWQSKDAKARLFLATWENDNEWYPVQKAEWTLQDSAATALIFGVTVK